MDLENVPEINISKKKEIEIQKILTEIYESQDESYERWKLNMLKFGYTKKQIDRMFD